MSSIDRYDDIGRIEKYDADMDVMHPNRGKMADIALDFLAGLNAAPIRVLDLGCGTGFVAERLAQRFSGVNITCLDGAQNILDLAKSRLEKHNNRIVYKCSDFRELAGLELEPASFDAVVSSYALHHLNAAEKVDVLRECRELLVPGGLLFNADLVKNESPEFETRIQDLRVEGILERAGAGDERFANKAETHAYLGEMERAEGDQPLDVEADLALFREAGFSHVSVLWLEYREAVICAQN